ncbi:hypothetical protein [Prosthecobacter sp.]|uniref:hypothetical protein n=1 Tax=Prosthecobacter sp. TaxID=1965333 RepID=UPI002AB95016|nr:hypothetical protein [Prosthecobacter sp.]MDZ4405732.1 hypothetical protein [Prosthecobacter sp.]
MIPAFYPGMLRRLLWLLLFSLTPLREGKADGGKAGSGKTENGQAETLTQESSVGETGEPGRYRWVCTVRGDTFREVRVTKVTASQISFQHATGVATLPLIEMPLLLQEVHGFDPHASAAELPTVRERRIRALAEAEQSKAAMAALLNQQKAEHAAIKQIEREKIKMRIEVRQVTAEGAQCDAWPIVMVELPGKHSLSSGLMKVEGIKQTHPDRIFVAGLTEVRVNAVRAEWVYPVNAKKQRYAISANRAYTERKGK